MQHFLVVYIAQLVYIHIHCKPFSKYIGMAGAEEQKQVTCGIYVHGIYTTRKEIKVCIA